MRIVSKIYIVFLNPIFDIALILLGVYFFLCAL
jgi:hypothetical protein